ncbi:MAG: alkylphosphonate utilization protein [Proteobacteria bacterium]|nr:MAG: alkylphosphonate utilization protein [Pseudomonadota bacterium]
MEKDPACPECAFENTYADGALWVCPACSHEWDPSSLQAPSEADAIAVIKDANGNILKDGDSVTVIKDLKVKGSSSTVKVGTKVRNIQLRDGGDGHDIACKIDGIGSMNLKSEYVRKA